MFEVKNLAVYLNDLIILDVEKDKFYLIEDVNVNNKFYYLISKLKDEFPFIYDLKFMRDINFLNKDNLQGDFLEERWFLPKFNIQEPLNRIKFIHKFSIVFLVLKCNFIIRKKGMFGIVNNINNMKRRSVVNKLSESDLKSVINYLSDCFIVNNIKSNCISYSFCLTLILLKMGVNCKFIIGVRTRPFYSHAWVEINNIVINDDKDIRKKLSVILEV